MDVSTFIKLSKVTIGYFSSSKRVETLDKIIRKIVTQWSRTTDGQVRRVPSYFCYNLCQSLVLLNCSKNFCFIHFLPFNAAVLVTYQNLRRKTPIDLTEIYLIKISTPLLTFTFFEQYLHPLYNNILYTDEPSRITR